jgi:hypothetical protein
MKILIFSFVCLFITYFTEAQTNNEKKYRNFPLIAGAQFHSVSTPLKGLKTNFRNPGVLIGTEISFNKKGKWLQQLFTGWQQNNSTGSGFQLFTQTAWRPKIAGNFYTELKAGIGVMQMHSNLKMATG